MGRRQGFSLSEILISVMILSVLAVLLVGVIPSTVLGLRAAGQRVCASELARGHLERLRQKGLDQLRNEVLPPQMINGSEYSGEIQVVPATASNGQPLDPDRAQLVTVIVRWKGRGGNALEYRARSILVRQL